MSSTDVQNMRDWEESANAGAMVGDPVVGTLAGGLQDTNLDWLDKRLNNDPPGGGGSGTPAGGGSPAERVASKQFETRDQDYDRMARAAGVKRTGSDADLLGFSSPRRRVGLARRLVGG